MSKTYIPKDYAPLLNLYDTQKNSLSNITRIQAYASGKYMLLDSATRRNLELTETMREKRVKGSLLWVLDRTKTAMGARLLRQYLEQPLVEKDEIEARYDAIDALSKSSVDRDEIREYLSPIYDMERLLTKISYGSANPRDLVAFRESLKMTKPIRQVLSGFPAKVLQGICRDISDFSELTELLDRAIVDDPPLAMKDGGILKPGYDETVDHYRNVQTNGKQILADLEEKTREVMHDGWYHTGDVAWQDEDGFFWYVGRADDVIKSSGYRIGPFEIESVIMELPYVLECGVSAAPDEVRGQVVKASVVLTKGTEPSEDLKKEIQNYVKQHTAPYKYPRIVVFRDELPKTVSGKIQRAKL